MKSMLFAMAFVLSACSAEVAGHKVIDTGGQSKEDYSYEYTENGCPTQKQTFKSRNDYCNGLKDDQRNHYCARGLRYEAFKANCSEMSWQ